jgi:hypothetical protein
MLSIYTFSTLPATAYVDRHVCLLQAKDDATVTLEAFNIPAVTISLGLWKTTVQCPSL